MEIDELGYLLKGWVVDHSRDRGLDGMAMPAGEQLARGIPAGILIAALVWMLPQSGASSFWVILLFTWLIGAAGFTHIIAGSVEMAYLAVQASIGPWEAFAGFFAPVLIGNIVGGTAIFAFLAWAQVRDEIVGPDGEGGNRASSLHD